MKSLHAFKRERYEDIPRLALSKHDVLHKNLDNIWKEGICHIIKRVHLLHLGQIVIK